MARPTTIDAYLAKVPAAQRKALSQLRASISYYPFSGRTLTTLADELAAYSRTKSALHFTPEKPLPKALVKKLLRARIAEAS